MVSSIRMQKLGHQKYSLAGWSMGAFTAAIMALKNPEQTRKLVVWGMGGYFDEVTSNNLKSMYALVFNTHSH